ncbi:MAG: ubiquinone biosynthesis protein, partial [Acidimicrobiia bacterium]|nr:ubiquinone biosynthesis protein [Acidimicrobiia bacterium]
MRDRYGLAGRLYDVVSLEPLLYRRPRARLLELLGPLPGATVVDIGCG